ncbi:hypothetical protein CDFC105_93956 [Clostridioides difficile]|nr:hypothetical protein CDFC105_93956 [Clostridioides difficile]
MCIRDSGTVMTQVVCETANLLPENIVHEVPDTHLTPDSGNTCLLYTSDAADEEDSVDLGGRRII